MKSVSSNISAISTTGLTQRAIQRITLWETPYATSSLGFNQLAWDSTDTTQTVVVGTPITAGYNALTNSNVVLAENGQLWGLYGTEKPFGIDVTKDITLRYEGYFHMPVSSTGVTFKVIGNPRLTLYLGNDATSYPSGLSSAFITHTSLSNSDYRTGTEKATGWTANTWHTFRLDWVIPSGSYGKAVVMYKTNDDTNYRLVDCSRVNVTGAFLPGNTITGVYSLQGQDKVNETSVFAFNVSTGNQFVYDSTTDAYGILRANRLIKVEAGFETDAGASTFCNMGMYSIDKIELHKENALEYLTVTCKDLRKKAANTPNFYYPDYRAYDLMGYDSNFVFSAPDGVQRYVAWDSFTLAETVRGLLYYAGFTSSQLWSTGSGNYKIEENNLRLDREALYKIVLPGTIKKEDLHYSFPVENNLLEIINEVVTEQGYEFGMDSVGDPYLRTANNTTQYRCNDSSVTITGVWTTGTDINSLAGKDLVGSGVITISPKIAFTGYNLIFNLKNGATGSLGVQFAGSPVNGFTNQNPSPFLKDWSYRQGDYPQYGYNPCVYEAGRNLSTTGLIKIFCTGQINFAGYELFNRDRETAVITFPESRVIQLNVQSTDLNMRNSIVVGGSDKGIDLQRYVVSRTTDYKSVGTPASKNFVGTRKTEVINDPKIIRQDVADYLSLALLKRYRRLDDIVTYSIPPCPQLELGDCISINSSDAGLTSKTFWVDTIDWNINGVTWSMNVGLNPYEPFPSRQEILEPSGITSYVTNFTFKRTDGISLNPASYPNNFFSSYVNSRAITGAYAAHFAEENPPVQVQISFDLWSSATVTLALKQFGTNLPMATFQNDRYLPWGHYDFYWDGRWWNKDMSQYASSPMNPDYSEEQWVNYMNAPDPTNNLVSNSGAGYFYPQLSMNSVITPTIKQVLNATGQTAGTNYGKVIVPIAGATSITESYLSTRKTTRKEVELTEFLSSGGYNGIFTRVIVGPYPLKLQFTGHLDLYILATTGLAFASGDTLEVFRQVITPDSFAIGTNLYQVTSTGTSPWTVRDIQGETDWLDPNTTGDFLWDLNNLTVFNEGDELYGHKIETGPFGTNPYWKTVVISNLKALTKVQPYASGYFTQLSGLYPGKNINVGWYFYPDITAVSKTRTTRNYTGLNPVRIDDIAYTGFKHFFASAFGSATVGIRDGRSLEGGEQRVTLTCLNQSVSYGS